MAPRFSMMERETPFAPDMVSRQKAKQAESVRSLPKSVAGFQTRGKFVAAPAPGTQRTSAYVNYKKAAFSDSSKYRNSLRSNAGYITRDGALDAVDENGNRLTLDEVHDKTHGWDEDRRYYKIVLSPEFGARLDLEAFTQETMAKVEKDLLTEAERDRGAKIEYVMAQHHDTDHPHVHIMMRATVEGRELRLSAGYFCHGLEARAEEVATAMIGYRIGIEQDKDLAKEQEHKLLMARRAELGLDPATGKPPEADPAAGQSTTKAKTKEQAMDRTELDGGIG